MRSHTQTHCIWLREASLPVCLLQPHFSCGLAAALLYGVRTQVDGGFHTLYWGHYCWRNSGLHAIAATVCTHIYRDFSPKVLKKSSEAATCDGVQSSGVEVPGVGLDMELLLAALLWSPPAGAAGLSSGFLKDLSLT